jgi:hypothetical protein
VSRETLRKWMTKVALWCPRSQRVKAVHVWRERRASFGELVMQDSSPFRWLEDRGPACQLVALIERLFETLREESTASNGHECTQLTALNPPQFRLTTTQLSTRNRWSTDL